MVLVRLQEFDFVQLWISFFRRSCGTFSRVIVLPSPLTESGEFGALL